jgi:hypothetical protein
MSAPYLPVPDLTRQIENRDCFPSAVTDDELHHLIQAANQLVSRAEQELVNRLTAQLWAEQRAPR